MPFGLGFVGADGTGKTTLLSGLQRHYSGGVATITEVARKVISRGFPLGKAANQDSYIELIREQFLAVREVSLTKRLFISDRTLLDAYCYSMVNSRLPRPHISQSFIAFLRAMWLVEAEYYRFYFYMPIEFPIAADGVREIDTAYQSEIDAQLLDTLREGSIPFEILRGSLDQRLSQAVSRIDSILASLA